jgi:hypothetical protein
MAVTVAPQQSAPASAMSHCWCPVTLPEDAFLDHGADERRKHYTLLGPDRRSYRSTQPGTLGGHRGARIYGRLDCPAALRAIGRGGYVRHRVFFRDEATAIAAGFRPCAVCCPRQYRAFRAVQRSQAATSA